MRKRLLSLSLVPLYYLRYLYLSHKALCRLKTDCTVILYGMYLIYNFAFPGAFEISSRVWRDFNNHSLHCFTVNIKMKKFTVLYGNTWHDLAACRTPLAEITWSNFYLYHYHSAVDYQHFVPWLTAGMRCWSYVWFSLIMMPCSMDKHLPSVQRTVIQMFCRLFRSNISTLSCAAMFLEKKRFSPGNPSKQIILV